MCPLPLHSFFYIESILHMYISVYLGLFQFILQTRDLYYLKYNMTKIS